MRFYILLIFSVISLFGYTVNASSTGQTNSQNRDAKPSISVKSLFEIPEVENLSNSQPNSTNSSATKTIKKQNIFISYIETPEKIFVGQQFSVKVKSIIATDNFDKIKNRVVSQKSIKVLNIDENWTKKSDSVYEKTLYLKAKNIKATFPDIYLELYKKDRLISSRKFPKLKLNIINLHTDKHFCNILADSLDVLKTKTTKFNEESLMVVIEIVAKNANLKDFKLSNITRGGIDSYEDNFPMSKIYYYAIVPKHTRKLTFTYFNIGQNRFIKKSINLILSDEEISTQSDLNPQDSSFNIYKNIAYGITAFISILIFFKRRRVIYLLLSISMIALLFFGINPLRKIKIAQNSKVYILPTKNSTIFYITPSTIEAQKLNSRENYIKVILPNGKIGWIKDENVIKN